MSWRRRKENAINKKSPTSSRALARGTAPTFTATGLRGHVALYRYLKRFRDNQARSREQAKKTAGAEKRYLEKEVSLLRAENKELQSKLADAQKAEEKQCDEKREKREALERAKKLLREEEERHEGTKHCLTRRTEEYVVVLSIQVLAGCLGSAM